MWKLQKTAESRMQPGLAAPLNQLAQIRYPIIGLMLGQLVFLAVAVAYRAGLHARTLAGDHVAGGVADHQAVFRLGVQRRQSVQNHVRRGLAREAVGSLHMVEVRQQAELLQDGTAAVRTLSGCGGFASAQNPQRLHYARIDCRLLVAARRIQCAILLNQLVDLRGRVMRQYIAEYLDQMETDIALQKLEGDRPAVFGIEHLLDGAANILGGIEQSAVNIEKVELETRDHAGCGRSPSVNPGRRRPASGRMTCCVSPESLVPDVGFGGKSSPLMIWATSLP